MVNLPILSIILFFVLYFIRIASELESINDDFFLQFKDWGNKFSMKTYTFLTFFTTTSILINGKLINTWFCKHFPIYFSKCVFACSVILIFGFFLVSDNIDLFITDRMSYYSKQESRYLIGFFSVGTLGSLSFLSGIYNSMVLKKERWLSAVNLLIGIVLMLLSGTRSIFIASIINFILLTFIELNNKKSLLLYYCYLGIACILVTVFYYCLGDNPVLFDRLRTIGVDNSSMSRFHYWKLAMFNFFEHPLNGDSIFLIQLNEYKYPHNLFLEILMSTGLIGFVCSLLYFGNTFVFFLKDVFITSKIGIISYLFLVFFIYSMFSGTVFNNIGLWVCSAFIVNQYLLSMKIKKV